ncbi:Endonuclease/exonuclease/phosphatase [Lipomyces orientalis]|uniref:Endonuclease/exonuclease/phosphatase n=1 Tax=Lipomyces orientalis TaxID=1233043 RepID=A0ACC3TQJ5_9ASCO
MTSLVLSTSTHKLTFHPAVCADSGGTIDTPFYILEAKATQTQVVGPGSPVQPVATDLTVHDSISIDDDVADSDRLLLKLQDRDIGTIPKSEATSLAEFVLSWRSALAALEEQVPVTKVSSFEDPLSSDYVTTRLVQERDSFFEEKTVQFRLITWNLHGEVIGEDLRPLLFGSSVISDLGELQDLGIFFVGLQEADPLTPTTLSTNQATITRWASQVLECLGESYVLSASSELLGMVLLMFSHKKLASQITQLEISSAGTGVLGYWGNKGAVCLRFVLGDSELAGVPGVEIAVMNMHLSSGIAPQAVERRRWEMSELSKRLKLPMFNGKLYRKQRNGGKNRKELLYQNGDLLDELDERVLDVSPDDEDTIAAAADAVAAMKIKENGTTKEYEAGAPDTPSTDDSDKAATISTTASTTATTAATINSDHVGPEREINSIVFVLGDLNYRLAMDRSDIAQLVTKNDYNALLFWDQLRNEIKEGSILVGFQEGPIAFQPTYKYDIGTNVFDTSEKARIPAYTDRILYTPYPSLAQLDYESFMHYISSDHKPVAATFELRTMLMDADKRAQIVKRLLHDLDARENESRPKVEVEETDLVCPNLKVLSTVNQKVKFKNYGNTQVAWEIEIVDGSLLEVATPQGVLPPGGIQTVRVSFRVPPKITQISEIFILRIINRQDYFISISGNVLPSCFGASLEDMIQKPSGARNGFLAPQAGPQLNIPREIWKCVDFLSSRITRDIFRRSGDETVGQLVRDWLDNGDDFDATVLDSLAKDGNKGMHSVAEQFVQLLALARGGVIPEEAYDTIIQGSDGVPLVFEAMPRVNVNTLIYIASFLREVKRVVIDFDLILDVFDKVLVRIPKNGKNKSRHKKKRMEFLKGFIG